MAAAAVVAAAVIKPAKLKNGESRKDAEQGPSGSFFLPKPLVLALMPPESACMTCGYLFHNLFVWVG